MPAIVRVLVVVWCGAARDRRTRSERSRVCCCCAPCALRCAAAALLNIRPPLEQLHGPSLTSCLHPKRPPKKNSVFCARRLRSLYKGLKFLHGKGRYQKRKLDAVMVTEPRWLLIPLMSAERAWAQAMEIKRENEDRALPHRRHHSVRRLAKAGAWAAELARLAAETCDARGALEAEAYSAWMGANALLERESDWARAHALFSRARKLFLELAKVGDLDSQALCGAMAEEIEPSVRFCAYRLQRAGGGAGGAGAADDLDAGELLSPRAAAGGGEGGAGGLLASKLAALQAEAQAQRAAQTSASFEWRGATHAVRHERVRVALHAAAELAAALEAAGGSDAMDVDASAGGGGEEEGGSSAAEARLAAYDRAINALGEARAAVRALAKANAAGDSGAGGGGGGEAALEELSALGTAIGGALLERTLERGEAQVAIAEARFEAANARAAAGKKGPARQERGAKPEDLLRLHEALMHHCEELGELASGLGGRQGEALGDVAAARGAGYAAGRCYYVAHTYLAGGRRAEAAALFARCAEARAPEAAERLRDLPKAEAAARAALPRLEAITDKARAWRLVAAAEAAAEAAAAGDEARKGVASLGLEQQQQTATGAVRAGFQCGLSCACDVPFSLFSPYLSAFRLNGPSHHLSPLHAPQRYLAEALDSWESFGGAHGGRGARVFRAPYALQAAAARPIMLDTAAAGVEYPPLAHRTRAKQRQQQQQTQQQQQGSEGGAAAGYLSGVTRYFGWGGGGS